jgi:hypothetical protein
VVLERGNDPLSGHVGFFRQMSADGSKVYVLGGNQGDAVSIAAFPANKVLGYRWPPNAAKTVPQTDDAVLSEVSAASKVGVAVAATGSASALPIPPAEHLAWLGTWKDALAQVGDFVAFAGQHWMLVGASLTMWTGWRLWSLRKAEILNGSFWKG